MASSTQEGNAIPAESVPTLMPRKRVRRGLLDHVYTRAAYVFQTAHVERPLSLGLIRYAPAALAGCLDTQRDEIHAYELAFNALKYQDLLEDALLDSCFYQSQQMPDDLMALVVVMLYDLQDRKFQPRGPMTEAGEGLIEEVRMVESSLFRFRTKLAASMARYRIKQGLLSIHHMLPKNMREKHQRKHKVPLCAWVNTLKTSLEEVCDKLKAEGFIQVGSHTYLEGSVFCLDTHCPNVLLFPQNAQEELDETALLIHHSLILQERSRSLAACAVRPLLVNNSDILMAGSFSAQTVAHIAVHAAACSARLHVCGVPDNSAHRARIQSVLSSIGCKNVSLLEEDFAELSEWDSRVQKVRVVLLLPRCTASALSDPMAHVVREDGDRTLLQELSQRSVSNSKLESLVSAQRRDLSHALAFAKVHAVVYCTCSVYAEENQQLVKRVMENASVRAKKRPFKIVSTGWREEDEEKFFRMEESDTTDGCFICVLKREQEQAPPETVQDILARAAAKGLLDGLFAPKPPERDKRKERKSERRRGVPAPPPPLLPPNSDAARPLDHPVIFNRVSEPFPTTADTHVRAGAPKLTSKSLLQESSDPVQESSDPVQESSDPVRDSSDPIRDSSDSIRDSSDSSSECSDAPDVSAVLNQSDLNRAARKAATNTTSRRPKKIRREKPKAPKKKGRAKRKSKSRARARRGSRPSRGKKGRKPKPVKARTLAPLPPLTPLPPQTRSKGLHREKRSQWIPDDDLSPRPGTAALNEVMKMKEDVERYGKEVMRSMGGFLPPISPHSSFRLSQSSSSSISSRTASTPSSRSKSRESVLASTFDLPSSLLGSPEVK